MKGKKLLIIVNTLVFLLLVKGIDLYFGAEEPISTPSYERVIALRESLPLLTDSVSPTDQYLSRTENLSKASRMLRTDSNGFVIGHPSQMLDTARVHIIFFGGSTTECRFMPEESRFPYRVGQILSENGRPLRTLNAGFSGNHSVNSTLSLVAKGIDQRPRMVVMMHAINDLVILSMTGSYYRAPASRLLVKQVRKGTDRVSAKPLGQRIIYSTEGVLSILYPNILARISNPLKSSKPIDEWAVLRADQGNVDMNRMLLLFEQSLRTFVNIARANGIDPILMTQANRMLRRDHFVRTVAYPQDSGMPYDTACMYYARFNERVRIVAMDEQIHLVELERIIPANSTYFYDGVHLTEAGSLMVADSIAAQLKRFYPDLNS